MVESACNAGDRVWPLGREDSLREAGAGHSGGLAWRTPWTEKPGGLQPMRSKDSDRTQQLTLSPSNSVWLDTRNSSEIKRGEVPFNQAFSLECLVGWKVVPKTGPDPSFWTPWVLSSTAKEWLSRHVAKGARDLGRGVFPGSSRWVLSAVTCILLAETRAGSTPHSGETMCSWSRQRDAHKSGMSAIGRPRRGEREGGRVDASAVDAWPPERGRVLSSVLGPQFTVTCYNSSP